jgi:sec-independent protein translocase protein TatC
LPFFFPMRRKTAKATKQETDPELPLVEHLAELRTRLVRSVIMIALASTAIWFFYDPLYRFFTAPIRPYLPKEGGLIVTNWLEPFFIQLKLSLYCGLVASAPFWILEMWAFIAPGLTPQERKPIRLLAPLTILLFLMGVVLAHLVLPMTFGWALGYMPPEARLLQKITDYVEFLAKMYLAFGVAFQLPVVLMFLASVGIVDSTLMKRFWRQAVIIIMLIAAIITPSNDPVTMMICATPMALLYLLSIFLVGRMEQQEADEGKTL